MDSNIFLFYFENATDIEKVLSRRPWTLKGAHLVLKLWDPKLLWHEIDFSQSTFWVQVHGLPGLWQKPFYLHRICSEVGHDLEDESTMEDNHYWKRFIRVRVNVNISMPLKSRIFLPRTRHDDLWIGLKYEKLLECCFNYGMLGHLAKDCNIPPDSLSNQFGVRFPTFGEWLNADNACTPP